MGACISWMAFQGITKEEALSRTGLRDTGTPGEMYEAADVIGAELPDGWFLIFAHRDVFMAQFDPKALSAGCRLVEFETVEVVMTCTADCYLDGQMVWYVMHGGEASTDDLDLEGTPPEGFAEIRDRLFLAQEEDSDVDCIYEIPVETAALAVCGFRHDESRFAWGVPAFTVLEPA